MCESCEATKLNKFVVLLVIVLLAIAYIKIDNSDSNNNWLVVATAAAAVAISMMWQNSEHMESHPDDQEIDSTQQLFRPSSDDSNKSTIDNSDIIDAAIMRGSSLFLPNNSPGVTATSSAGMSAFTLGEHSHEVYNAIQPINDAAYNVDQALARKQQHRSNINKKAVDGAVRSTKNLYQRLFQNELRENSEREWWNAESTDFETDFRSYD
jgi:hypothetical protein